MRPRICNAWTHRDGTQLCGAGVRPCGLHGIRCVPFGLSYPMVTNLQGSDAYETGSYYTFLQSYLTNGQNCFEHSAYRGHHCLPLRHRDSPFSKTIHRPIITTRHWAKLSIACKTVRHRAQWTVTNRNSSPLDDNALIFQQNPACIFRHSEKHFGND